MNAAVALSLDGDVLAAQRGDKDAFTRLIDATRNVVCAITLAIVRDVASSEDVAQEVFVAAWGSVGKLRNPSSFLPWLRQLARNQAHSFLRARSRFGRRHAPWVDDAAAAVADPKDDAQRALIQHEDERALAAAMDELPDESREIVTLYYREGKSVRQVADLLGLGEDAAKKRLERARTALRQAVLERAGEALRKTAPGAAFTAAVVAAIALATPATAAAATAGATKALGGTSTAAKLGGALGGAVLGPASAIGAIAWGGRILWRRARDDRERRGLTALLAVNLCATVGFGIAWSFMQDSSKTAQGTSWALYAAIIFGSYGVWLPRIISRRLALERLEDPTAERRQKRDRIRGLIGGTLGFVLGLAAVIYRLTHG